MSMPIGRRTVCVALGTLVLGGTLGRAACAASGEAPSLALAGYDPVAYFTRGKATPGSPKFEYVWAGAVYRFASARDLALFRIGPERYLPQYDGECAASLAAGRRRHGDPEHWLVYDGRLYLFAFPGARARMARDPGAMKAEADAAWVKLSAPRR